MFGAEDITAKQKRALIRRSLLRATITSVLLLALYFIAPMTEFDGNSLWLLVGVLVAFAAVSTWQVMQILKSDRPVLQGTEALAAAVPLYLLGFSSVYFVMATTHPAEFSETLTKMSSLYFTVTVFATVGFGDITAVSDSARAVVTAQIVLNLGVLGIGGRILYAAIDQSRQRRAQADPPAPPDRDDGIPH